MDEDDINKLLKELEARSLEVKPLLRAIQLGMVKILEQLNDQDERIKGIESYLAMKEANGKIC